jgi:hypothetical protein
MSIQYSLLSHKIQMLTWKALPTRAACAPFPTARVPIFVAVLSACLLLFYPRQRGPSLSIVSQVPPAPRHRIVVPYLTSAATCWRNTWYIAPFIDKYSAEDSPVYSYVLSDSLAALNTTRRGIHTPGCTGGRLSANGNACRYDVAFRHFFYETDAPWLLVAIDDTYLNERNLFRLLDMLEEKYDPLVDQLSTGQAHHDWGTFYPHGGAGILYTRAWAAEFLRRNFSFEKIHADNYRYTYDITTGLVNLNYFERAIWLEHPWLCVVAPESSSMAVLASQQWKTLPGCPSRTLLVDLRDVSQFHISPFVPASAGCVKDLEFAPPQVKIWRPESYKIRFCWSDRPNVSVPFTADSLKQFELNLSQMNRNDSERRLKKHGTVYPW